MTKLNIGNTAIDIKTATNTVRANITFLQSRIETIKLTPVSGQKVLHFFKHKLEAQELMLNWLARFE